MKKCTRCSIVKNTIDFTKDKRTVDGFGCWCKQCKRISDKTYRNNNKDSVAAKAVWKHKHAKYRLSRETFQSMIEVQSYKCAICHSDITHGSNVDHNHKTGEIRGLLCNPCNRGLGFFRDTPMYLQNACDYLNEKGHYGQEATRSP